LIDGLLLFGFCSDLSCVSNTVFCGGCGVAVLSVGAVLLEQAAS
jgi:hypothetical protein